MTNVLINELFTSYSHTVRPDNRLKSIPIFQKLPKSNGSFYLKGMFSNYHKSHQTIGVLWKIICHQEFSKIAQSGHIALKSEKVKNFFLKVIKESFDQTLIKNQMKFALNDAVQLVWPCIS